jgi:soluble lytic murein transglycosylase-like protein
MLRDPVAPRARRPRLQLAGALATAVLLASGARVLPAQRPARGAARYDDAFRKYSKRYFGIGFDWRLFKAQGIAESGLDSTATSRVGARGVMQLMPTTFREIASHNPDLRRIDDPEWNIAAAIYYDRSLWRQWESDSVTSDRREFMLASYNAGRGTLRNAQEEAAAERLDPRAWPSIETVAPRVRRWRHEETLAYVRRITATLLRLDERGRVRAPDDSTRRRR